MEEEDAEEEEDVIVNEGGIKVIVDGLKRKAAWVCRQRPKTKSQITLNAFVTDQLYQQQGKRDGYGRVKVN